MKFVITIGREYGSGGRFVGRLVAERLGINFYDNELLFKAAQDSGLSEVVFKNFDERKDGFLGNGIGLYAYDMTLSQKVFLAQFDTIKKLASEESCVIVGRCADYVLKDNPNLVSVFICAPMEDKIERAVKYYDVDAKKAESIILKKDKHRQSYYNLYTDRECGKASNYDLCINSKIGIESCVDAIEAYVRRKFGLSKED